MSTWRIHKNKLFQKIKPLIYFFKSTNDTRSIKTPLGRASFQLQNTVFQHSLYRSFCILNSVEQ